MKYAILWKGCNPKQKDPLFREEICDGEEALAATFQRLTIDSNTGKKYIANIEIKVYPFFQKGQLALNKKTGHTRVIQAVNYQEEFLDMYNHDDPEEAKLQEIGLTANIPERWNINDCIPLNLELLTKGYGFKLGTEMGVNGEYNPTPGSMVIKNLFN